MDLKIYPSNLQGEVMAPASKSLTHRALICGALATGRTIIYNPLDALDIRETIICLKELGAKFTWQNQALIIDGINDSSIKKHYFQINESASTLRLLLPIISLLSEEFKFTCSSTLINRITTPDLYALEGLTITTNDNELLGKGKLSAKDYYLSGKLTTQLISGMILALPFLDKTSTIHLIDIDVNNPYLQLTIQMATYFGVNFLLSDNTIKINPACYTYQPQTINIEGDYSSAAFWLGASYFHHQLNVGNLPQNSLQGDQRFFEYLEILGVKYQYQNLQFSYYSGKLLSGTLDITNTPDLAPILASLASLGVGTIIIRGIEKLKYKESNRSLAIMEGLNNIGANIEIQEDALIIHGRDQLIGGVMVDGYNDHRIVMALAVIASVCKRPVVISNAMAIRKSYPYFFEEFVRLGGKIEVV